MAPQGAIQTDEQMAAVLTYVRNSFGNSASAVTPDQITPFRGEIGKPFLTVEDLIPPPPLPTPDEGPLAKVPSGGLGASMGEILFVLVALAITGLAVFRMKLAND